MDIIHHFTNHRRRFTAPPSYRPTSAVPHIADDSRAQAPYPETGHHPDDDVTVSPNEPGPDNQESDDTLYLSTDQTTCSSISTSSSDIYAHSETSKEPEISIHDAEARHGIPPVPILTTDDVVQRLTKNRLFSNEYFEVRASKTADLGVVALRTLRRGDIILAEQPLFTSDNDDSSLFVEFEHTSNQVRKVAFGLHRNAHLKSTIPKIQAIWSTNSFSVGRDAAGLFAIASRFNHACSPGHSVDFRFDTDLGCLVLTVRAERIEPGAELTLCYGRRLTPILLYLWYGFRCGCGSCPGITEEEIVALTERW